jgi:hypothetical protein
MKQFSSLHLCSKESAGRDYVTTTTLVARLAGFIGPLEILEDWERNSNMASELKACSSNPRATTP